MTTTKIQIIVFAMENLHANLSLTHLKVLKELISRAEIASTRLPSFIHGSESPALTSQSLSSAILPCSLSRCMTSYSILRITHVTRASRLSQVQGVNRWREEVS
ncbi:uncharacterized protein [Bemisia tabaci]|uniref:uncharacterized protein n=1 Tax=Bemisia tabaci TaxID=7038 RepID=UPI003B281F60